jgi:hypothetical protein
MSNPKLIRGAMGLTLPPSEPEQESKPINNVPEQETKSSINSDPEAMDALNTLKRKGYDAEDIESALNEGGQEPQEPKNDIDMKAGLRDNLSKLMQK